MKFNVNVETNFSLTFYMLNLKVVWKCYNNLNEGIKLFINGEFSTRGQHNIYSYLTMLNYDYFNMFGNN
jgi:hypothetical protein